MTWMQLRALDNAEYLRYIEQGERHRFWGAVLGLVLAAGCIGTAFAF